MYQDARVVTGHFQGSPGEIGAQARVPHHVGGKDSGQPAFGPLAKRCSQPQRPPLVVHFVLADGRETLPVIVHDYDELRAAAPGSYGPMGQIFGEYESGTCDLLDLAAVADFLFPLPGSVKPPSGGGERKNEADEHETEFDNEDDFRQAVELP